MNVKAIEAYECGICHGKHLDKYVADQCCRSYNCRACGKELDKYHTICDLCSEKENFEKAEKIPLSEYQGWVFWEGYKYNEGFAHNFNEIRDFCEEKQIPLPEYVWACDEVIFGLDADSILQNSYEEAHEDAIDQLVMVDELEEFCDRFNAANKDNVTYYASDKKAIIIQS